MFSRIRGSLQPRLALLADTNAQGPLPLSDKNRPSVPPTLWHSTCDLPTGMATTVWKGHLTFGLVSIPIKLYRAARAERVSFRQLHRATGARVRQTYLADDLEEPAPQERQGPKIQPFPQSGRVEAPSPPLRMTAGSTAPRRRIPEPEPEPEPEFEPPPREISRSELAKGYEYAKDRFVMLTKEELEKITPRTAHEMQIVEFVKLDEVDPVYFETSYYVAPDRGGERAYALLVEALRQSNFVAVAQLAMHNREHIALVRPGRRGLLLHTMFYDNEVRSDDEFAADTSSVSPKELELAMMLVNTLAAPFEPGKYRDTYREKLDALIQAKIAGEDTVETRAPASAPVVNILEALQESLQGAAGRKPPAKAEQPDVGPKKRGKR